MLTDGNTLLGDEELEILGVLRMNRGFMEFMRTHYGDVAKVLAMQHFGKTLVNPGDAGHSNATVEM